uniref:Uncharacterized protein n=1 Tax=Ditylenchus dipsaci TaxID=166011 RepID=A0A915E0M5_9BILA
MTLKNINEHNKIAAKHFPKPTCLQSQPFKPSPLFAYSKVSPVPSDQQKVNKGGDKAPKHQVCLYLLDSLSGLPVHVPTEEQEHKRMDYCY